MKNVVYKNGNAAAAISCNGAGSREMPVRFIHNFIYDAGSVGIGLSNGAVCIVEENIVSGTADPGIVVKAATALKLNRNKVTGTMAPGFVFVDGATVVEMIGNAADGNQGPRFMLRGSTIAGHEG
ncbi:MAG: right-handed parallel beta-helix repeat-containing protein [Deltaproteobacteria bacterium]|nr:right-handed parallel beta-helix repeat-containing protein [Deltaproteobacteria bacterium]